MPRLPEEENYNRRMLHAKGLSDREAAKRLGISPSAYGLWRRNRGLAPNGGGEAQPDIGMLADAIMDIMSEDSITSYYDDERFLKSIREAK